MKPSSLIRLALAVFLACGTGGWAEEAVTVQQTRAALLGGMQRGVCYSGFRSGQHPDRGEGAVHPGEEELLEDLRILSGAGDFELILLYDAQVDSEVVLRLIESHKLKLKVLLCAWLAAEVSNPNCPWLKIPIEPEVLEANRGKNRKEVERAIRLAGKHRETVVAVAVGNEALVEWSDHLVPVEVVTGYVRKVKEAVAQPVTVAENYNWWVKHGAVLAKEVDFVSVHLYPFWEGKDIEEALSYSIANLEAVRAALPESRLVITEAGWATVSSEFGPRADEEKQARYFRELFAWTGKRNITTFFFEAFDEEWKGAPNNPMAAEKHWGVYTVDRKPKKVMQK